MPALARPVSGRSRVARTLQAWVRLADRTEGVVMRPAEVNGQPGAVTVDGEGKLLSVLSLDIAGGEIRSISSVVNPDKLRHLGPVGDMGRFIRSARREAR